mgnify:CR=1 FL=1
MNKNQLKRSVEVLWDGKVRNANGPLKTENPWKAIGRVTVNNVHAIGALAVFYEPATSTVHRELSYCFFPSESNSDMALDHMLDAANRILPQHKSRQAGLIIYICQDNESASLLPTLTCAFPSIQDAKNAWLTWCMEMQRVLPGLAISHGESGAVLNPQLEALMDGNADDAA